MVLFYPRLQPSKVLNMIRHSIVTGLSSIRKGSGNCQTFNLGLLNFWITWTHDRAGELIICWEMVTKAGMEEIWRLNKLRKRSWVSSKEARPRWTFPYWRISNLVKSGNGEEGPTTSCESGPFEQSLWLRSKRWSRYARVSSKTVRPPLTFPYLRIGNTDTIDDGCKGGHWEKCNRGRRRQRRPKSFWETTVCALVYFVWQQ